MSSFQLQVGIRISWLIALLLAFNMSACTHPDGLPDSIPGGRLDVNPGDLMRARAIAKFGKVESAKEASLPQPMSFQRREQDAPIHGVTVGEETSPHPELTQTPVPLQFVYPLEAVQPVSAWRPPLYPIPWALTPYDHFYFLRPIMADVINWPNADYRYGGVFFEDIVHTGVDIPAPIGTPVLAVGSGRVTWAGYGLFYGKYDVNDPYGLAIQIRHDFGYQGYPLYTVYAHLSRVDVIPGQGVRAGDPIGLSGDTGKVTGPHLHFEVRLKEGDYFTTRNPELWMVPPQGWGVLAGRVMNTGGRKLTGQLVTARALSNINCPTCQTWKAFTYGGGYTYPDPYYQENLVIGDLPEGRYEIQINYLAKVYSLEIDIRPGLVSYFTFRGRSGFTNEPLPVPGADFVP